MTGRAEWVSITDSDGRRTSVRTSAVRAVQQLENGSLNLFIGDTQYVTFSTSEHDAVFRALGIEA